MQPIILENNKFWLNYMEEVMRKLLVFYMKIKRHQVDITPR